MLPMNRSLQWRKYPFLRMLIPLLLGIVGGDFFCPSWFALTLGCGAAFVVLCLRIRLWMALDVFLCLLGMWLVVFHQRQTVCSFSDEECVYEGEVIDISRTSKNTKTCVVQLNSVVDSIYKYPLRSKILLYLPKDSLSNRLQYGHQMVWYGNISRFRNNGNPFEFDYARYWEHKGMSGMAWVHAGEWFLKTEKHYSLKTKALAFRTKLLERLEHLPFEKENLGLLSAILLGDKSRLTPLMKQRFSVAGLSHLLALSGLHIGLLTGCLLFFLRILKPSLIARIVKGVLVLLFLWSYAYITGLSPSVLRSTILFSLLAIGLVFDYRRNLLNALGIAAFFMLLYQPYYIYDIGFQLSYLAVFSLIVVGVRLESLWSSRFKLLTYFWRILCASLSVQVFTLPLVIYYFSNLPLCFWISNLFALPILTLILYLSCCLWLALMANAPLVALLSTLIDNSLSVLNEGVIQLSSQKYAAITDFTITPVMLLLYALLCAALFIRMKRKVIQVYLIFIFMGLLAIVGTVRYCYPCSLSPTVLFYAVHKAPAVHFVLPNRHSYVWELDSLSDYHFWLKTAERFCLKKQIDYPKKLTESSEGLVKRRYFVYYSGCVFGVWCDDYWRDKFAERKMTVDYLYVNRGFKGSLKGMLRLFKIRHLVLDKSLTQYQLNKLKNECKQLGLSYYDLKMNGALKVKISG